MTDLVAHRGFAAVHAENTVPAAGRAARVADGVEVDVRRAADDLVVVHDATVDRVTDTTGRVETFSAGELAGLEVFDSGTGIPRLAEVIEALPDSVTLHLELKQRGLAADALNVAGEHAGRVVVSAFDDAVLRETRRADPATHRAALFAPDADPAAAVETARDLGCVALHPHHSWAGDVVDTAHEAGLAVNAWTIERAATAERLREAGVDGLIADRPV